MPYSEAAKFKDGERVYYCNETLYELDENGNPKGDYPEGAIAGGNIDGFAKAYHKVTKLFSKTEFEESRDMGYKTFED